nr:OmpW family outer membrane protein [Burkholderia cepacia]
MRGSTRRRRGRHRLRRRRCQWLRWRRWRLRSGRAARRGGGRHAGARRRPRRPDAVRTASGRSVAAARSAGRPGAAVADATDGRRPQHGRPRLALRRHDRPVDARDDAHGRTRAEQLPEPGVAAVARQHEHAGVHADAFFSEKWAAELGAGIPPVLTLRGHGSIALPLDRIFSGVQGRFPLIDLANTQSNPLATTRAWLGSVVFKYYLGERDDRFRPFAGIGVSYTRFTNTNLNPVFQRKLASLGGLLAAGADIGSLQSLLLDPALFQRIWDAGGDLLLSGKTNVSAKVKSVWEPVFTVGASYQITRQFWITGMVTYIPLRTKITLDIDQPNRQLASNTFDIAANPVLASVLLAFRF